MAKKILKLALCLVVLVWLAWPVVELFEMRDTGNDWQYTFVVLGICAGAVCMFSKRRQKPPESAQDKSTTSTVR